MPSKQQSITECPLGGCDGDVNDTSQFTRCKVCRTKDTQSKKRKRNSQKPQSASGNSKNTRTSSINAAGPRKSVGTEQTASQPSVLGPESEEENSDTGPFKRKKEAPSFDSEAHALDDLKDKLDQAEARNRAFDYSVNWTRPSNSDFDSEQELTRLFLLLYYRTGYCFNSTGSEMLEMGSSKQGVCSQTIRYHPRPKPSDKKKMKNNKNSETPRFPCSGNLRIRIEHHPSQILFTLRLTHNKSHAHYEGDSIPDWSMPALLLNLNPYFATAIQAVFLQFQSGMLGHELAEDRLCSLYMDTGDFRPNDGLKAQVQFWKKLLNDVGTVLQPPRDHATPPFQQSPNGSGSLTTHNVDLQGPEHLALTTELVDRYTKDLDSSRVYIISHSGAPSIPSFIWDLILQGTYVDLKLILPHALNDEEVSEIQTMDQWCHCWVVYSRAVTIAFPHRTSELSRYATWISRLFNEIENALHPNILQMDVALRTQVDQRQPTLRLDNGNLAIRHLFTSVFPSDESSLDFHFDSSPVSPNSPATSSTEVLKCA
ncbi:hypothetical protein FRC17_011117 [Serendipita sp. 399]|nr:hypothetical protein FRC17_011117 [Serendipita sp. 399]